VPRSDVITLVNSICDDVDECKYDLGQTKNITLAAASVYMMKALGSFTEVINKCKIKSRIVNIEYIMIELFL